MSRCYPYLRNGEAVSETINTDLNKPSTDKLKKKDKKHKKSTSLSKLEKRNDDDEPERSSLTEEHGRPVCHHSLSSHSTTRSRNKRKSDHLVSGSEKKLLKAEGVYKRLFGDWSAPPVVYDQNNFDDQSWLSGTRTQDIRCDKRIKIYQHDEPGLEASSFSLCARNLPEADIYALPYTISF